MTQTQICSSELVLHGAAKLKFVYHFRQELLALENTILLGMHNLYCICSAWYPCIAVYQC